MEAIAENDDLPSGDGPRAHPAAARWLDPCEGLVARIAEALAQAGAEPGRCVVLLPYAQLLAEAQRWWAQARPDGFAPRFETTQSWSRSLGAPPASGDDLRFDMAHDLLTAQELLDRAGLGAQRGVLGAKLVEAAQQLGRRVAAVPPAGRDEWAVAARLAVGVAAGPQLAYEAAVARIALEWALASGYAGDVLLAGRPAGVDHLVVLEGLQAEPFSQSLRSLWHGHCTGLPLAGEAGLGRLALHAAQDAEDEAQRAAACVLRHLASGRAPVALAATDRALTRRIRAVLGARGVDLRDETGWKLSTTRAAAGLMGALRACAWNASSDAVLNWLKGAPAFAPRDCTALERALRRAGARDWSGWKPDPDGKQGPLLAQVHEQAEALRAELQRGRPLAHWLATLRALLHGTGQWNALAADAAGADVLAALRLEEAPRLAFEQALAGTAWATRRLSLAEFTAWVDSALEAGNFMPGHPAREQVVILPLSQMLGRAFGAVVLPGCDELRLPAAPEPEGAWTAAQREALGLPSRADLQAAALAAWQQALQAPHGDVLWRSGDDGGESLLPSPLVQLLQLQGQGAPGDDPRQARRLQARPVQRPQPSGAALPVARLSASAYEDLRRCPYRFFALRQLGLQEADELDAEVDKRDFGLWLHAVLRGFHETLAKAAGADVAARRALIEAAARQATEALALAPEEFLPFEAAWPQVRDGYLDWLAAHEGTGARFAWAERWLETPLALPQGLLRLVGQVDRLDRTGEGPLVIDYKTESADKTRQRTKAPLEDTQLAFYAALLAGAPDVQGEGEGERDEPQAAYVNVGERDGSRSFAQPEVAVARDALLAGIADDLGRIATGVPLPALGEGAVCDFCGARGLCRKDSWT